MFLKNMALLFCILKPVAAIALYLLYLTIVLWAQQLIAATFGLK